jgi:hypothetical protein
MQQVSSSSALRLIDRNDKCQDCLGIDLEAEVVRSKSIKEKILSSLRPKKQSTEPDVMLYLTINFGEQWEKVPFVGQVKFGLKRGQLKFRLKNCKIPLKNRELAPSLQQKISKEKQTQESSKRQASAEFSLSDIVPVPFTSKGGSKAGLSGEQTVGVTEKVLYTVDQIHSQGSDNQPVWIFQEKAGEQVLIGMLKSEKIATLIVETKPCNIDITFEVRNIMRDVCVTDVEGMVSLEEIKKKQSAIIERKLIRSVLKPKLAPYISQMRFQYE